MQRDDAELAKFHQHHEGGLIFSQIIPSDHAHINEGFGFVVGDIFYAIPDDGVAEGLFQISNEMHMHLNVVSQGDCEVRVFENPIFSAAGTPMTVFNKNRSSDKVSGATVTHTPTLTNDGTELTPLFVAGGSGGNASGGEGENFAGETVLKADNNYLFRIINKSGQARTIGARLAWYEPKAAAP